MPTKPKTETCMLHNETVDLLPMAAENFYRRLVDAVDDEGRCVSGPEHLFSTCYPLRACMPDADRKKLVDLIRQCLATLIDVGLANEYTVDNVRYLRVNTLRFKKPRTPSKLPAETGVVQLSLDGTVAFGDDQILEEKPNVSPLTPLLNSCSYLGGSLRSPVTLTPYAVHFLDDVKSGKEKILVSACDHEKFFQMTSGKNFIRAYSLLGSWWNTYCDAHLDDGTKVARSGPSIGAGAMSQWMSITGEDWFCYFAPLIVHLAFASDLLTRRVIPNSNRNHRWVMSLPWLVRKKEACRGLLDGKYAWANGETKLETDMVIEYVMSESPRKMFRAMTYPEASQVAVSFVDYWERDGGKNRHNDWKKTLDSIRDQRIIDVVKGGGR